jgi:hypothetical protein
MINYTISANNLQDLLYSYKTYHYWKDKILSGYPDIVSHEVEKQFKFFTLWPGILYFYADDNNVICKDVAVVRTKILVEDEKIDINPNRSILLGVFLRNSDKVIRFAVTEHDILA